MARACWYLWLLAALLIVACDGEDESAVVTPTATAVAPTATTRPTATATATVATPTSEPVVQDVRVTYLSIPAVGIDVAVQGSVAIPDTRVAAPGCPARPPGGQTWSVPNEGITTPEAAYDGLENTAWIFGHSRWQGVPGVFFALQDIEVGDDLFVDGFDRQTGEEVVGQRYVVEGIYLADTTSGGELVIADSPEEVPAVPTVVLQTSVRERGQDRPWILDRAMVEAKATTVVEGDVDDPCKYLLLFVVARAAEG